MNRGERRRREREIEATLPAPGVGKGWTLGVQGRKYLVVEGPPRSFEELFEDTVKAQERLRYPMKRSPQG